MDLITNPYDLAKAGLVTFSGDMNPLDYDGAWYNTEHWESDGYADCIRVCCMPDGPEGGKHVIIERLTINKPDAKGLKQALDSCGITDDLNAYIEIECCLYYGFYDPNDSDYREPQSEGFVVLDHEDIDPLDVADYCRIHGAKIATEDEVWARLNTLVGRDSCK